jgi:hypothetical protein
VLQRVLPRLHQQGGLPEYLLIGDDDTWINPVRLVQQYERLDAAKDKFVGFAHPFHRFPWGGAGYL